MEEKNNNRQVIKKAVFITSIFVIFISVAYAFLNQALTGTKRQVVSAENLRLEFQEGQAITLRNAMPIYDEVGMIQEPFHFKLVNNSDRPLNYIVKLIDITAEGMEKLDTNIVKYGLTKDNVDTIDFLSNLKNNQIDSGMILANQTIEYNLRLWIDYNVEDEDLINGKSLSYRIDVEAGQVDGTERKIQFDLDGGQLAEVAKTAVVGEKYGELPISTKAGYNFLGWFNEKDEYVDENTILDAFTKKLTAKWGVNQYTVAFNSNGGTVSPNNKQINFNDVYGELPIPTKVDSIFLGWYTETSGGDKIESTSVMNTANNHTLYAHWKDPYQDKSGASRPVLSDELIPVKIANDGTVTKADTYEEWYDYEKKVWANVVILLDKSVTYSDNQVIPESNIESYFVWIPRYRYKIFNEGNYTGLTSLNPDAPQTIEIEFETKDIPVSNGTTKGTWLSHPAFQDFVTNGFWVGKFESGYKDATSTTTAQVNSTDSTKLQIKPNVYSWRNITIGNAFKVSYDYKRELESHMMKNTEWGAVAYLSHSNYGGKASLRFNNNNSYLTGYASVTEPTCGPTINNVSSSCNSNGTAASVTLPYNTLTGYASSTTGNISGIYDMSGGAWEYVMGYSQNANAVGGASDLTKIYGDFFTNSKWDKYYNQYNNPENTETAYQNGKLGDATKELGPFEKVKDSDGATRYMTSWYGDFAHFVYAARPWFARGGLWYLGVEAGVFCFHRYTGGVDTNFSFRAVLSPSN